MIDFFLKFLESQINYQVILLGIALYLASVWVMFSLWVFIDARKRFNNMLAAVLLSLFVLPFNLPGLIFYLIIRPEEDILGSDLAFDGVAGGVNVPLVNYTGRDGEVVMALNLQLSPRSNPNADMNINVGWTSGQEQLSVSSNSANMDEGRVMGHQERPTSDRVGTLKAQARGSFTRFKSAIKKSISKADTGSTEQTIPVEQEVVAEGNKPHKKAKK